MAHGGWPGAPGSVSSWRRHLRLSRLTSGSSAFPRPACVHPSSAAALLPPHGGTGQTGFSAPGGALLSLQQPRPRSLGRAEAGGGPGLLPSLFPSPGRRGAGRQDPGRAQIQPLPHALRASWSQVGTPGSLPSPACDPLASPSLRPCCCGRSRLPRGSTRHPASPAQRHFPAALAGLAVALGRGLRQPAKLAGPRCARDLSSLGKRSCVLLMPSHVWGPVTECASRFAALRVKKETAPQDFEKRVL
ncbi:hypothetical protein P7K49_028044 [Saguinus oedipus]|uniref:Uncharacterized protein n=1 Tax=Saguinus oedipus TaxID=9490 RepID=A0ABQ9UBE6_SAGOE|nr:hypothetical protein P7K49_028044 [Saguinus oedipus]